MEDPFGAIVPKGSFLLRRKHPAYANEMYSVKNIFLTGFMGCGKTTVGRLLAARLRRTFIDTDQYISAAKGISIAEIFAVEGEAAFRTMEQQLLRELAAKEGMVIATGGKMLLDPAGVGLVEQNGIVVCLCAEPQEILRRVLQDGEDFRPLLVGENPLGRIKTLLKERHTAYAAFPQVATDGKEVEEVVKDVLSLIKRVESSTFYG